MSWFTFTLGMVIVLPVERCTVREVELEVVVSEDADAAILHLQYMGFFVT